MKKNLALTILITAALLFNATAAGSGIFTQPTISSNSDALRHLCSVLKDAKTGDLSFCLGYIKNSKSSNHEIADFILTWSPDIYKKQIPSIFRSKIDRIVKLLGSVDYEQLIMDIDLIKNSQLTISEMVKLVKGTRLIKIKN